MHTRGLSVQVIGVEHSNYRDPYILSNPIIPSNPKEMLPSQGGNGGTVVSSQGCVYVAVCKDNGRSRVYLRKVIKRIRFLGLLNVRVLHKSLTILSNPIKPTKPINRNNPTIANNPENPPTYQSSDPETQS